MATQDVDEDYLPIQTEAGEAPAPSPETGLHVEVGLSIAEVERRLILATLTQSEGNKNKAAEILGISLKTLYNRLNAYKGFPPSA